MPTTAIGVREDPRTSLTPQFFVNAGHDVSLGSRLKTIHAERTVAFDIDLRLPVLLTA
jgi:hypothetical protein